LGVRGRGNWNSIIVLNAHAQTENKSDCTKDSFNEELKIYYLLFCMGIQLGLLPYRMNMTGGTGEQNVKENIWT
jgi:hypothetical protein